MPRRRGGADHHAAGGRGRRDVGPRVRGHLRQGELLPRAAAERPRGAGAGQRPPPRAVEEDGHPRGGDKRLPLPQQGGRARARDPDVRAAEEDHPRRQAPPPPERRLLRQDARRDGGLLRAHPRGAGERCKNRRALQRRVQVRRHLPAQVPGPRRDDRGVLPRRDRRGGAEEADRRGEPAQREGRRRRLRRAPGPRARRHPEDALRRLLPHRLGLHPLREGARHPRRSGARLGRRLPRRLLDAHHRHRSHRQQAAVRALPQPGAHQHAGLRHRLLHEPARRGDLLRHRQVRQGQRRPDRHHAPDQGAVGRARHRARHGHPVRRGRQGRQVRPRAHPGEEPADRRGHRERAAAQGALRREPDLPRAARRRQGARGAEPPRGQARRRRRHRRQAALGVRAVLPPRGRRGRHRHAVRQGHGREGRAGEVRLPRPQDADCDPDLPRARRSRAGHARRAAARPVAHPRRTTPASTR